MNRCPNCMKEQPDDAVRCLECGYEKSISKDNCLIPGTILKGRYCIGRVLGVGGFGKTYIGYDEKTDSKVAVKEYFPSNLVTHLPGSNAVVVSSEKNSNEFDSGKKRFMEEASRLAQLGGEPEIVQVYDFFEENNTAYIVMEFLNGETLLEKLKREGRLKTEEALDIMDAVLKGLIKVHERGMLHRDIAPDNIFLCSDGKIKLFDFGSARTMNSVRTRSMAQEIKKGYSPPEQYSSEKNKGTWTDVYAAAATCYRMITGTKPPQALERIGNNGKKLKKTSEYGIRIKKPVENAILNALQPEISRRTQTAEEFRKQLSDSNTRLTKGKNGKTDLGGMSLGVIIPVSVIAAVLIGFGVLLGMGIIHYDPETAGKQQLAEGMIRIPNLVNLSLTDAMEKAKTGGFSVKVSDKEYSDTVPISRILCQDISAGSIVRAETTVAVILSAGIEQTYSPWLTGLSVEEAEKRLFDLGFKGEFTEAESWIKPGCIITQNPGPETAINTGDVIVLVVSKGKDSAAPGEKALNTDELVGKNWNDVLKSAEEKGFYIYREDTVYNDAQEGTVISAEKSVSGNGLTEVKAVVSAGRERTIVSDVVGNERTVAIEMLTADGLVSQVKEEYSDTVEAGKVISQEPAGGTRIPKGTEVQLSVSLGRKPVETMAPETVPKQNPAVKEYTPAPAMPDAAGEPPTISNDFG